MNATFGTRTLPFPSQELGALRDSNDLLDDVQALRDRFEHDGYLLIRGLIDPAAVSAARIKLLEHLDEHNALDVEHGRDAAAIAPEVGAPMMQGRREITHHAAVLQALESPAIFEFFDRFYGEAAVTLDFKWLRATGTDEYTGAHCDTVYMSRGSDQLMTCWIPVGEIPVEQGTLAICVGSHRLDSFEPVRRTYGQMDVDRDDTEGWFTTEPLEVTRQFGGRWMTTSFMPGDVLLFGMHTMHASTTNTTTRYRISCDVRFQPASHTVDERWVGADPIGHTSFPPRVSMDEARNRWGI